MTAAPALVPVTLAEAIVDSSVLLCILMGEPAAPLFIAAMEKNRSLVHGRCHAG